MSFGFQVLGFGSGAGDGGDSGTLVQDTFTDSDGVQLDAHTPDIDSVGGGWIIQLPASGAYPWFSGNWLEINSNQCRNPVLTFDTWDHRVANYIDCGESDVIATVTFVPVGIVSTNLFLNFRLQDRYNFWSAFISRTAANTYKFALYDTISSTATKRDEEVSISHSDFDPITFSITANGTSIQADWPSASKTLTYTSSALQTETNVGFGVEGSYGGNYVMVDNFLATVI